MKVNQGENGFLGRLDGRHVVRRRCTYAPASHATSHDDHEKMIHG